jgi:prolyl-tRNA synthetase
VCNRWREFVPSLDRKCIVLAPWCERIVCEEEVKTRTKGDAVPDAKPAGEGEEAGTEEAPKGLTGAAKTLCIPFEQAGVVFARPRLSLRLRASQCVVGIAG